MALSGVGAFDCTVHVFLVNLSGQNPEKVEESRALVVAWSEGVCFVIVAVCFWG